MTMVFVHSVAKYENYNGLADFECVWLGQQSINQYFVSIQNIMAFVDKQCERYKHFFSLSIKHVKTKNMVRD